MSTIVYGPQGCGKTRHAEQLRQHFRARRVIDGESPCPWPRSERDAIRFKAGDTLYLTNEAPPYDTTGMRHILAFDQAMAAVAKAKAKRKQFPPSFRR